MHVENRPRRSGSETSVNCEQSQMNRIGKNVTDERGLHIVSQSATNMYLGHDGLICKC